MSCTHSYIASFNTYIKLHQIYPSYLRFIDWNIPLLCPLHDLLDNGHVALVTPINDLLLIIGPSNLRKRGFLVPHYQWLALAVGVGEVVLLRSHPT